MPGSGRRLAAVLLTDMVGYSALAQQDERHALALVREQERLLRPLFRSHRGRVVKSLGDGFLVEFASALEAVRCAVEVQSAVARRTARSNERDLELRIGIHLGDVVHRGGDVFGDAVNIAARIQPLAHPGGVTVSQQVYDQVRNKVKVTFVAAGAPALKNIETPVRLYRLDLPSAHPPRPKGEPTRPRIAVLPLVNISGRAEDEFFADGITEELIQTLSRITGLRVIGRASMMHYKRTDLGPSEVARELEATAVVEGGIRTVGSRVRVTARLLDARSSESLWSEAFDREIQDVFGVQIDISRQIAKALEVEILGGEHRALVRAPTADPAAHAEYLQGRYQLNRRTEQSLRGALAHFRAALRIDPKLARAHAGIAEAHSTLAWLEFVRPRAAFPRARAAARRALAVEPALPDAHTALGFVLFLYDRDWVGAEREFRTALELDPNLAIAHQYYSDFLKALGRFDEALAEIRKALELEPLSLAINTAFGHVLYLADRYDESIAQYRRALALDPGFAQAHLWFGRPYLQKGEYDAAIREVRTAVELTGGSTMSLSVLGHAYAAAGRRKEAREILADLVARSRTRYVPSYWIALIYVGLGERKPAFEWLAKAERERSAWLAWVKVEPRFRSLQRDPRFARLLRELRLG